MKRILAVVLTLATAAPAAASNPPSWTLVKALHSSSPIIVRVLGSPEPTPLDFVSADDDALTGRYPHTGVITMIPKDEIVEIVKPAKGPSWAAVTAAAAVGAAGGWGIGIGALFSRCYGSCTPNVITAMLAMVGLPIAAGVLTAQATRRKPETIYHA